MSQKLKQYEDWQDKCERGYVASLGRNSKRRVYLKGAPGAISQDGLLPGYWISDEKATAVLQVYRIMVGRDPETGERL